MAANVIEMTDNNYPQIMEYLPRIARHSQCLSLKNKKKTTYRKISTLHRFHSENKSPPEGIHSQAEWYQLT